MAAPDSVQLKGPMLAAVLAVTIGLALALAPRYRQRSVAAFAAAFDRLSPGDQPKAMRQISAAFAALATHIRYAVRAPAAAPRSPPPS